MKVYSPSETASLLEIKTATLRKYSLLLENQGYEIKRNSKKHRYYRDKDIITLRNVMTGSDNGITLEESVKNVVNLKGHSNESNVINNGQEANDSDIKELKEMINKQNELIYNLTEKLDQQQEYIIERLQEHEKLLIQPVEENNEMELTETKEKKGFFGKLFNR